MEIQKVCVWSSRCITLLVQKVKEIMLKKGEKMSQVDLADFIGKIHNVM